MWTTSTFACCDDDPLSILQSATFVSLYIHLRVVLWESPPIRCGQQARNKMVS